MDLMLPFKVGDEAEARSFTSGFRSAWFRCKVEVMCVKKGHLECYVEYFDFPDEKKTWMRLYQKPPSNPKQRSQESRQIMLRPSFPRWYRESELPEDHPLTDVVAIVSDAWKVGDLIDWWCDGCYWTGNITQLLGDSKVQLELLRPPIGEGGIYVAPCEDLRPSLDWSLEKGWSVPLSGENDNCWYAARLVPAQNPDLGESTSDEDMTSDDDDDKAVQKFLNEASLAHESRDSSNQKLPGNSNEASSLKNEEDSTGVSMENSKLESSSNASSTGADRGRSPVKATPGHESMQKKHQTSSDDGSIGRPETLEEVFMGLEETANKIRWLKGLLQSRGPQQSHPATHSWTLLETNTIGKQE